MVSGTAKMSESEFQTRPDPVLQVVGYTSGGKECADPAHWSCLAKRVTYPEGNIKFFVKRSTEGSNLFETNDTILSKKPANNRFTGRDGFEFVVINETGFNHYLTYLQTGNRVSLKWAERELS